MGPRGMIGMLCVFIGAVWIAQGVDVLKGSPMTGHIEWAVAGTGLALIGAAFILLDIRTRRDK